MFLLDSLFISGMKFVFEKVSEIANAEAFDETLLHDQLLRAQLQCEAGEITDDEFGAIEGEVFERLRQIRAMKEGTPSVTDTGGAPGDFKITGIEATFEGDDHR
ncbi:MAG: gas vesicle protein GvpG [Acidobacteriota bacterium]|nr:gas vesicle protein GvpG [Acidobacteriota bacterium]